jgi:hypothetical protein
MGTGSTYSAFEIRDAGNESIPTTRAKYVFTRPAMVTRRRRGFDGSCTGTTL